MPVLTLLCRLDRYILRQLVLAVVLVTAGLVALIWLTQSLRFIQTIIGHGLSPLVFIKLTALLVPGFLATILPITCFLVTLFTYVRLAGDRELTIMRGLGLSNIRLARSGLVLAVSAVLLGYFLTLSVVPQTVSLFRNYQYEIRNQIAAFLLEPGVFTPVSNNVMVYVQSRDANGLLKDIIIEDDRTQGAPVTILATSGELIGSPQGPIVVLEDGSRQQIDPHTGQLDILTFKNNTISLAQAAKTVDMADEDAAAAPLQQLFHPPTTLSPGEQRKWLVEAQRRLSAPLSALGYTLIALVAALGGGFKRNGNLSRVSGSVVVVVTLVAAGLGVGNFAARSSHLLFLIWVWAAVPILISFFLLLNQRAPVR